MQVGWPRVDATTRLKERFHVRYLDEDWEEDVELSFEHGTAMAVHAALMSWVEAMCNECEVDDVVTQRLRACKHMVVEVTYG